jgi:hypothetical protein
MRLQSAPNGLQFADPSENEAGTIQEVLHRIKGDTVIVRNPHDLANAICCVETYLQDLMLVRHTLRIAPGSLN